jgi:hypothetical protein
MCVREYGRCHGETGHHPKRAQALIGLRGTRV